MKLDPAPPPAVGDGSPLQQTVFPFVSDEALASIRRETAVDRPFTDSELRHWLREATRQYQVMEMARAPWQRVLDHARAIESSARRLLSLLQSPATSDSLPAIRWDGTAPPDFLETTATALELLVHHSQLGPRSLEEYRKRFKTVPGIGPDTVLVGAHLPFIFSILYGDVRKGEARGAEGRARDRFVAACCYELGLARPSPQSVEKTRQRFRQNCANLADLHPHLAILEDDGVGLVPPRSPSPDCQTRIAARLDRVSAAERAARSGATSTS